MGILVCSSNQKNKVSIFHKTVSCTSFLFIFFSYCYLGLTKETTLERADLILQLLMFVSAEKEGQRSINFFLSIFCPTLKSGILVDTYYVKGC